MKRPFAMTWSLIALAGMLIAGCSKDDGQGPLSQIPPTGVTNEMQAVQTLALTDGFVQNDEVTFADQAVQPTDYATFGKIDGPITPKRWGRFITGITKTVTTELLPGDTITIAHIKKTVTGVFKIKGTIGTVDTVITKAFTDTSRRNVLFRRVNKDDKKYWMNWRPVASSLIAGGTVPPSGDNTFAPISITKVELFAPNDTVTVTDPTSYFMRYRWTGLFGMMRGHDFDDNHKEKCDVPELKGGDPLILHATIVSASTDTDVVVLRYGFDAFHGRRQRMTCISVADNGNNTFTRVFEIKWNAHFHTGFFNAGVDALTKPTIYDDTVAYSVSWWGVPYRVY